MAKILTVILFDNDYFLNKENGKIFTVKPTEAATEIEWITYLI